MFKFLKNKIKNSDKKQDKYDEKLVYSLSKSKIPCFKQLKYLNKFLSKTESGIIFFCLFIIIVSSSFLLFNFLKNNLEIGPKVGGEYAEALIGTPKYINPLYANRDIDNDLSSLIFSSLFKRDKNSELIYDLIVDHEISEDNKIYTFEIRDDVFFHNGDKLEAEDIIFTFNAIKNSQYKSPFRPNYNGVNIEKIDEKTVKFILDEAYAPFLELLTFGILPSKIWTKISPEGAMMAEINLKPIGSGMYRFKSLTKDKDGHLKKIDYEINEEYYNEISYLEKLIFKFYVNFEEAVAALNSGEVKGISFLPRENKINIIAPDALNFHKINLPQVNIAFINQKSNPDLAIKNVRQALALGINKNEIVEKVYENEARIIKGPILPNSFAFKSDIKKYNYNLEEAQKLLEQAGYEKVNISQEILEEVQADIEAEDEKKRNQALIISNLGEGDWLAKKNADDENEFLVINLTTVDSISNIKEVEIIKNNWEKLGIKTNLFFVPSDLIQSEVIRPRNFEVLLYGQVLGNDPDCYVFWHSSQIGENGLNISNFSNSEADILLEDARTITDIEERREKYFQFQDIFAEEIPAIYLYTSTYTYVQNKAIKNFDIKNILSPKDRFANISEWYIKVGRKLVFRK